MQPLIRRLLASKRPWMLLFVPLALSAAFATAAVAPPEQGTPPATCIEDAAGRNLTCSANDVRVSRFILVEGPKECLPGEVVKVKLQAELVPGPANRYDIGLYVAQDGGNARTGACYRDYLAPPLGAPGQYDPGTAFVPPAAGEQPVFTGGGPFLNAENAGDICGDIGASVPTFRDLGETSYNPRGGPVEVQVLCQDSVDAQGQKVPDQIADVAACVSWDNQANASPVCTSLANTIPGAPSKCGCTSVEIAGLTVPATAHIEVIKQIVPPDNPGKFDLLIDGAVRSGDAGVGSEGTTGKVTVSAGTTAAPGADHTVAEAGHSPTDLNAYSVAYACYKRGTTEPFATGTKPGPVTVRVQPNDDVVCVFRNTAGPRLRLLKEVINDNGGAAQVTDWTLYATGTGDTPTNLVRKSPVDSASLGQNFKPDVYTLSETYIDAEPGVQNGYKASGWICAKTATGEPFPSPDNMVTVNYGDDVTCKITNDDIQPTLTLIKKVENPYGGSATPADFRAWLTDATGARTDVAWATTIPLNAGTYRVFESGPDGYTASAWMGDCAEDVVNLAPGDAKACSITNTQNPTPSNKSVCVDGYVINHREVPVDGTQTDPPLAVSALSATGEVLATVPVGTDGYFKFTSLPADTPIGFQIQLPPGWEGIVPEVRAGGLAAMPPTSFPESKTCYRIVFKIRRLVTIPVLKWEEQLNGVVVPGQDWTITATPVGDPFARTVTATVTNGQGLLTLTPGTWNVAETVKPGWTPLTPPTVQRVVDQYQRDGQVNPIVFKNRGPICYGKITITKMGFGWTDQGQPLQLGPLAGWSFTLSRADGAAPWITRDTGGDGRVIFDGLLPGVYKVTESVQSGWNVEGENPITVPLGPCETYDYTFANHELIGKLRIYGTKWFQAWEPPYKGTLVGLPGWGITATLVGTESLPLPNSITTMTNALGQYEFTQDALEKAGMGFPGASIKVCEENRDHWIPKTPECVTVSFPYPVPPTYMGAKVDFTNVQDPPVQPAPAQRTPAAPLAPSGLGCRAYYTVVTGDTLARIANRYGAPAGSLMRANGIHNADLIYPGRQLCIP